ncbi:hypothetical protein JTE90_011541 [Oedothorax gibbosus]|uniref:Uncharacterized protein n=1 Tax=Oedothorax gibbosus TaxID=931172 RepID=A0AAV6UK17_9ARAC|nr:hypothetical protein JTE90_011541 [Oedothorax gibbosus]
MSTHTDSESQSSSEKMTSPLALVSSEKDEDMEEDEDIDVTSVGGHSSDQEEDEYFKPIKKLCMARPGAVVPAAVPPPSNSSSTTNKPLSSFFIKDILSHKPASVGAGVGIVRPWDLDSSSTGGSRRRPRSADDDSRSERSDSPESPAVANPNASPLDALFEMTSKAFEGLEANEKASGELVLTCFDYSTVSYYMFV